jgi:hypothetical protein
MQNHEQNKTKKTKKKSEKRKKPRWVHFVDGSKVSTPKRDTIPSATPIIRPKWDTTCLQL